MRPVEGWVFGAAVAGLILAMMYAIPHTRAGQLCWARDIAYPWETQSTEILACIPFTTVYNPVNR